MLKLPLLTISMLLSQWAAAQVYEMQSGMIRFYSDAPQELIRATSRQLKGALDIKKKTFAFKVSNASFEGFNSPLQREHFNENYIETEVFPESSFTGKIIEDADIGKDGEYKLRAKGKLKIHGVEQERIIDVEIRTKGNKMIVHAEFFVSLYDHNIKIPKVVYDKLAPDIHVTVGGSMAVTAAR
ncbi:hypothetical protein CAP35_12845 [Chitinophagaceae bacterium IBVUCB1]|nr:hypothetical protein CAP35_12845 [Chitinophagaceae bacterium IBVUCB1]